MRTPLLRMQPSMLQVIAAAAVALFAAAPSWADDSGRHPAYQHALSDLRDARAHLEHVGNEPKDQQQENAVTEIDNAIKEIKRASIMDGKDITEHTPIDVHLVAIGRLHRALELLDKAKADVSGEEDQADTRGLQHRVILHIDEARRSVDRAIKNVQDKK